MAGFFGRVQSKIKEQDLFGTTVQLTYKGEGAFNTVFGGCVSLIMVLGFSVTFFFYLYGHYFNPQFDKHPDRLNFDVESVTFDPMFGDTIAVLAVFTHNYAYVDASKYMRIQFSQQYTDSSTTTYFDAVYCKDLYADQIEAEKNGTSSTNDFTQAFQDKNGFKWVCPRTNEKITIPKFNDNGGYLQMSVLKCDNVQQAVYAGDEACATEFAADDAVTISTRVISTNFDPELYHKEEKMQLFYTTEDHYM